MIKKLAMSVILLGALLTVNTVFASTSTISLTIGQKVAWVGGQIANLPIAPFETKGVTYVPMRFTGEALGARVDWDSKNRGASFTLGNNKVTVFIDSNKYLLNGSVKYSSAKPQLKEGNTMVPIRIVSESLGAIVNYNPLGRVITIKTTQPPIAHFEVMPDKIFVGQSVQYFDYSYDPDGDSIVEWQWTGKKDIFDKAGTYPITLRVKDINGRWSTPTSRAVLVQEIPNAKPQAYFSVNKTTFAQGETINYYESSSDPDGDRIVDYQWTSKKRAFFKPGNYNITLKVKDEKGAWSDPYTVTISITEEVAMNEFQYNIANPLAGEIFPFIGIGDGDFTTLTPNFQDGGNVTLFYSNSPESVKANGILYSDTLSGKVRLLYHHKNVSETRKRFYLIARNNTDQEVLLRYLKGGYSGPSKDDFRVGQLGILRYLQSYYNRDVIIPPGKWMTINIGSSELVPANPGESIYGLYEVESTATLDYMCVALDEGKNLENFLSALPKLERDVHSRGTYENATRNITVDAKPYTRFSLADGIRDPFLFGYDAILNQVTQVKGNYGMIYEIEIRTNEPLVVIANPRGGGFAGTFALNGNYFMAPTIGGFAFQTTNMSTMLGKINGNAKLIFTPPASSNLPININFLPAN